MHLWLFVALVAMAPWVIAHSQEPTLLPPKTMSTTLVDVLSNDSDYSSLLHLLQRARLIPTLNRLNGSTLFAPTNEAIKRYAARNNLWHSIIHDSDETFTITDNIQAKLRQQLFFHLINYTVSSLPEETDQVLVLQTLHYPHADSDTNPPTKEPPPDPPWMPLPGGTLGGAPQRLRVAARADSAYVGVDTFGHGGAEIIKGANGGNGILMGIAEVLEPPADLAIIVSHHPSASYFHQVLTPEITALLNTTSELTVFLPVNEAWESLNPYERLYLESKYATDDLSRILSMHAVVGKQVKWSETFDPAANLTTLSGSVLEIVVSPEKTMISSATLVEPDVYASNGVLHLVSDLLIPDGDLKLTPEKYLLGLNCSHFVSLLHDADLTSLINDTQAKYTILAPRDDILATLGDGELPPPDSEELKTLLKYHFLIGHWHPKKLEDGMLLETALDEPGLDGEHQVLSIEVTSDAKKQKSIRFAGASVIGDPIEVNNTIIYFISRPLTPPTDALETVLPSLELSSFLAAILSSSLAEQFRHAPKTSILIPHNSAFKRLGLLVSAHLLAPTSKSDLEKVLFHHALDSVQYSSSLQNGSQHSFATLEGSDIQLDRKSNGSIYLSGSGGWSGMRAQLYPRNTLTQTGVIHELSDILIPRSVDLTVGKLMKAAKGSTMSTMVVKAGMEWLLNGTAPPEDSPWGAPELEGAVWTLLCPIDDAFKDLNLTDLYSKPFRLRNIIGQHLVLTPPPAQQLHPLKEPDPLYNNRPLSMDDSAVYDTFHSRSSAYGDVVFRTKQDEETGEDQLVIGIKGARGTDGNTDWARVMSWGRATTGGGRGGVIQINQMLIPYEPSWWIEYGAPSLVGAVGILAMCGFFYFINVLWRKDVTEATYEPIGGFGQDSDEGS